MQVLRIHDLAKRIKAYFTKASVCEVAHLDDCFHEGRLPNRRIGSADLCYAGSGRISKQYLVGSQQAVKLHQVLVVLIVKRERSGEIQIHRVVGISTCCRTLGFKPASQRRV